MITTQQRMIALDLEVHPRVIDERRQRSLALRKQVSLAYFEARKAAPSREVLQQVNDQYQALRAEEAAAGLLSPLTLAHVLRIFQGYAAGTYRKVDDSANTPQEPREFLW